MYVCLICAFDIKLKYIYELLDKLEVIGITKVFFNRAGKERK